MKYCVRIMVLALVFSGYLLWLTETCSTDVAGDGGSCCAGYCQCGGLCCGCSAGTTSAEGDGCYTDTYAGGCETICSAGTYAPSNSPSCYDCPVGTYSSQEAGSCTDCSAGSYSALEGSASCTPCAAGSYQSSSGQSSCVACPQGTACSTGGATSEADCKTCAAGTYAASGSSDCTECAAGTYAEVDGSSSCEDCPAGTSSSIVGSTNSTDCSICPAGTSSSAGSSSCAACEEGSYSSAQGSNACFACPSGTYGNSTGLTQCYDCPAGTASASLSAVTPLTCVQCSAGYYSSTGSASCEACPAGSYAESEGSSSCNECPAGTASSEGGAVTEATCQVCGAGTYSSIGATTCASCPTGTFSEAGASTCTTSCPAGEGVLSGSTSSSASAQVCGACNAGYFNSGSSIYCSECPSGSVSGPGAESCQSYCPAGEGVAYGSSSLSDSVYECGSCQPGYANNETSVYCIACSTGTISQASASVCVSCNGTDMYANVLTAATECVSVCPAGSGVSNGYSTQSSSVDACDYCSPGYYQPGNSHKCSQCTVYQFTADSGSSSYGTCPYPYQSFWFNWKTGSGRYFPCHAISIGLSLDIGIVLVVLLGLFALSFFTLIKDENGKWDLKNATVLLIFCLFPILDYLTDLLYILTSQYYNVGTFIASLLSIVFPGVVFLRRLWLRGVRAKFYLWEIPNSVWFTEYDNFYKILVTTVVISPYLLVNSLFLVPMVLVGSFLFATKVIAIGRVSNLWYRVVTGKNDFTTKNIIDTQVLNEALYTHIICETFFQIVAQVINNTFMNRWTILAYASISFAALNTLNGLYQISYYKFHRKVNLIDLPLNITMGGLLPDAYCIRATSESAVAGTKSISSGSPRSPSGGGSSGGLSPVVANPIIAGEGSLSETESLLKQMDERHRREVSEIRSEMRSEMQALRDQLSTVEGLLRGNGRSSLTVTQRASTIAVEYDASDNL